MGSKLKVRGERQHNAHEDFLEAGQHQGSSDFEPRELAYGPKAVLGYDPDDVDDADTRSPVSPFLADLMKKGQRIPGAPRTGGRVLDDDAVVDPTGDGSAARAQVEQARKELDATLAEIRAERESLAAERAAAEQRQAEQKPADPKK